MESEQANLYVLPIAEVLATEKLTGKLLSLVTKCKIKHKKSIKS